MDIKGLIYRALLSRAILGPLNPPACVPLALGIRRTGVTQCLQE